MRLPYPVQKLWMLGIAGVLALGLAGCSSVEDPLLVDSGTAADDGGDEGADGSEGETTGGGTSGTGGGDEPPPGDAPDDTGQPMDPDPDVCDLDTASTLFLSPDDSNSMSSPLQVRDAVLVDGESFAVAGIPIRTWEFFNYYGFDYPATEPGTVAVTPELRQPAELGVGEYQLQIGVSGQALSNAERRPINVTLVLDTSGSMSGHPLAMLQETSKAIAASLKAGDTISLVTWNTQNAVVLGGHGVTGPDDSAVLDAIAGLRPGGATDLYAGLVAGYDLAGQHYDPARINRIVLISDGGANAGITEVDLIAAEAGASDEDGIYMVGVGVGTPSTYNDNLMDSVTDAGKGAAVFVGSTADAWALFNANFVNTMEVAMRDVQVQLDLPAGFEIVRFSGEEFSMDQAQIEPQHLAPNDAMVFHQQIRTCAPELVDDATPITVTASYVDPVTRTPGETTVHSTFGELLGRPAPQLLKGAAVIAYVDALKAFKHDPGGFEDARLQADAAVATALDALPGDVDLEEIQQIVAAL